MSTATPGNINATDILRDHQERATPRPWKVVAEDCVLRIYGPDDAEGRPCILMTFIEGSRADADLIVDLRNILPELIRSMDNRDFRIRYLEGRVRELEAQLAKGEP